MKLSFFRRRKHENQDDFIMPLGVGSEDCLTLEQCFSNIFLAGAAGSGKTTGPASHLIRGLLAHPSRPGCLVMCQKPDEGHRWLGYATQAGRMGDVIHVTPGGPHKIDILDYELNARGGGAESAGSLLGTLMEVANRGRARNSADSYWPESSERQMKYAMVLVTMAGLSCGLREVLHFCQSLAGSPEQLADAKWRSGSYAANCLLAAAEEHEHEHAFRMAGEWLTKEWPELSDKTKSIIQSVTLNTLDKLLTSKFADLICDDTTWKPDAVINDGKILIFDVPVAVFGVPAQLANVAIKVLFQRAALRRDLSKACRPFLFACDEAANFCVPDLDAMFLSQSRQFRCICLNIVQNFPLVVSALGGQESARNQAYAWISNHATVIGCSNGDPETNKFMSALAGEERETLYGGSSGSGQAYDPLDDWMGKPTNQVSASWNEQYRPALPSDRWLTLRKGGKGNGFLTEGYVFQSGRMFSNGRTWIKGVWKQQL
jgi:TraM recognition site of TraD and TraG